MRYHAPSVPDSHPVSSITVNPLGSCGQSDEGGGAAFETVTVTGDEVAVDPDVFLATAVSVCEPFASVVVFNDAEYGAVVSSAPRLPPSSLNCTPATPTLSVAVAETAIVADTVAPFAGALIDTAGGAGGGAGEPEARQPM